MSIDGEPIYVEPDVPLAGNHRGSSAQYTYLQYEGWSW